MMTREEASEILSDEEISCLIGKFHGAKEALDLALSALRPVSREKVEELRGTWIWYGEEVHCAAGNFPIKKCSCCKKEMLLDDYDNFCPACGAPMTDKAVEMILNRMEEIYK